jgi:hypothetical protein
MTDTKESKALGILSIVIGGISLAPFLGVVSVVGLVLGVIGLIKSTEKLLPIIGTAISTVGVLTSPSLWFLMACLFGQCQSTTNINNDHSSSVIEYQSK